MAWTATVIANAAFPQDSAKRNVTIRYTDGTTPHDIDYVVSSIDQLQTAVDNQLDAYASAGAVAAIAVGVTIAKSAEDDLPKLKFLRAEDRLRRFDEAVKLGIITTANPAYQQVLQAAKNTWDPQHLL